MKQIEWSYFRPEDWPWILAMHIEQERKLGRQMHIPNMNERPVISCLVGRIDGQITNCVFSEAEIEVCAYGDRPLSRAEVQDVSRFLIRDAQFYGIRLARAFVPSQALKARRRPWQKKARKPPVKRILDAAGFNEVGESMVEFYRWIPKREEL